MMSRDIVEENWQVVLSALPSNWKELGEKANALNYMRGFSSPENLLRTLMLHIAKGYSLRETAAKAKVSKLASVSDVALLKRLKKSEQWLKDLCYALLQENGFNPSHDFFNVNLRVVDGTHVKEPGKTGQEWRFIYSMRLSSLECDFFKLSPAYGRGNGESFKRLQVKPADYIMGDRGYGSADGVEHIHRHQGFVLVRINGQQLPLFQANGKDFLQLPALATLKKAGQLGSWPVYVKTDREEFIVGRLCAIRKSADAIAKSHARLRKIAQRKQRFLKKETLEHAKFIVVFTTFPEKAFDPTTIFRLYRLRWQIELAFKRLKSLAQLGHLPKTDESSCRAWLYGKLLVGLLTEKLARLGRDFSPWGFDHIAMQAQSVA